MNTRKKLLQRFSENPELYASRAWSLIIPAGETRNNAEICKAEGKTLLEGYREYIQNLPEYD